MKTVGQILHDTRQKKKITLQHVSERTFLRVEHLQAIEENNFSNLPPSAYVRGFIFRYARFLGLDPEPIIAIFRRDYKTGKKGAIIPREMIRTFPSQRWVMTPQLLRVIALSLMLMLGVGYGFTLWWRMQQPPFLEVYEPKSGESVSMPVIISGRTTQDAVVLVNDQPVSLSRNGIFTYQLPESTPGLTKIRITSVDRKKRETVQELQVTITSD